MKIKLKDNTEFSVLSVSESLRKNNKWNFEFIVIGNYSVFDIAQILQSQEDLTIKIIDDTLKEKTISNYNSIQSIDAMYDADLDKTGITICLTIIENN